tara:strand:- start:329 stop:586 length:258 start_codon:yes stop_codon:yes gene_type:complete
MIDFKALRTEAQAEINAIRAAKKGKLTYDQLYRTQYLANVVTHCDIAYARQLGDKEWKRYERGTGHDTLKPYESFEAWATRWNIK